MAQKGNDFRLNGKPLGAIPRAVGRIAEFLDNLPVGDLLGTVEIADKLGYSAVNITSNVISNPRLKDYHIKVRFPRIMAVWGNKKTIRQLAGNKEILA